MTEPSQPSTAAPAATSAAAPPALALDTLNGASPWTWLARGWRDLWAAWPQSLFFGLCFWTMALVLMLVFRGRPQWTMTMVSGCFLLGPFLAMGLYDISRRRAEGRAQDLAASLTCWDRHIPSLGMLVLVLLVLELLWGRASLVVFAVFFYTGMPTTAGVLQAVFNPQNWQFVLVYAAVGGLFAALVFCTCAISIPMILDRDTDAISAGLRSFQLVLSRPGVMLQWGLLIVLLTLAGLLLPWGAGVLLVAPWLGHASWHGYRQVVPPAAPLA